MASSSSSSQSTLSFEQIFKIAKSNDTAHFDDVYRGLLTKSDNLTFMPNDDNFSILHYIVMHGALDLFNKVIAIPNLRLILLTKTATKPSKDILQISEENQGKSSTHKALYQTIKRLVTLDDFVEYAKQGKLNECRKMLLQDDQLANSKPPYRKYFLIHHLAYTNQRDALDQLRQYCDFDMELLTNDKKTASEVALEQNHKEFADYLESLSPKMRAKREQNQQERDKRNAIREGRNEKLAKRILLAGGKDMLDCFTCPLTKDVYYDPVMLPDGFTYERTAIQAWLDSGTGRSPMTNITLANTTLVPNMVIKQMTQANASSYEEIYGKARRGNAGDATVWDQIFQYIRLHPNELFFIASNRNWSIGHQIIYHGNLRLFKNILSLYDEQNPVNIQSKTRDSPNPKTILDIANERRGRFPEQFDYIKHLFDQDTFIQACKSYDWITIDNMLEHNPSLLNEKPPYSSNYFIHYLVFFNDVRKFADYAARDIRFELNLKNADGKTALDLARERHYDDYIEEIQALLPSDDRERDALRDESENDRSRSEIPRPSTDTPPAVSRPRELPPHLLRNLKCPITHQIFVDPVKATDGQTYEREAIIEWLRDNRFSPVTGEPVDGTLADDNATKYLIAQYRQRNLLP